MLRSFHTDDFRARVDRPHIADIGEREVRGALWPRCGRTLAHGEELAASAEPTLGGHPI